MADLKLGGNSIDNMMYSNSQIDKIYLGDTEIWSAIPADVKTHIARVIADGGTVPEQAKMVSMVKQLMAANLWNNCVFFGLPLGGLKKDANEFVSKLYDLKANADVVESTGTRQPKYDIDGSLLCDGGDDLISETLLINNPIRTTVNNFTICCSVLKNTTQTNPFILMSRDGTIAGNRIWLLTLIHGTTGQWYTPNSVSFTLYETDASTIKRGRVTNRGVSVNEKVSIIATWDGTDIDLTLNGISSNGDYNPSGSGTGAIADNPYKVSLCSFGNQAAGYQLKGNFNKAMIFNKVLTASEKIIVNDILSDWSL